MPADYAAMLRWLTGAIIAGNGSTPTGDIETVIGRPATSFEAFAQRNAAAWTARRASDQVHQRQLELRSGRPLLPHHPGRAARAWPTERTTSTSWPTTWSSSTSSPCPATPGASKGRQDVIDLYSDYDDYMTVRSADNLRVYRDPQASVVVLEYEVHGESVQTGRPYDNRFVSIVTVKDNKVTHWRDYLDPIAVFDAAGWPSTTA